MNAGTLPDGRVYILHNPIIGAHEYVHTQFPPQLASQGYYIMSCLRERCISGVTLSSSRSVTVTNEQSASQPHLP